MKIRHLLYSFIRHSSFLGVEVQVLVVENDFALDVLVGHIRLVDLHLLLRIE